jgi:hypothetical protein
VPVVRAGEGEGCVQGVWHGWFVFLQQVNVGDSLIKHGMSGLCLLTF